MDKEEQAGQAERPGRQGRVAGAGESVNQKISYSHFNRQVRSKSNDQTRTDYVVIADNLAVSRGNTRVEIFLG